MTCSSYHWQDFDLLLNRVLDGLHNEEDSKQLNSILRADMAACRHYISYIGLHGQLVWETGTRLETERGKNDEMVSGGQFSIKPPVRDVPAGAALEVLPRLDVQHLGSSDQFSPPSPTPLILPRTLQNTLGYFSESWSVAYAIATVITGLLILGFWLMPVSRPEQVVRQSDSLPSPLSPLPSVVGRITGLVDCKWSGGSRVSLGQKLDLASGLMEITYSTGAKVILQGPVTYSVETNGGYLAVGKLTGKLGERGESDIHHSSFIIPHSSNPQSLIPNPFVIRTPTATITDLGTEFGVEVRDHESANVVVFDGAVNITGNRQPVSRVATVGETIQIRDGAIVRVKSRQAATPFVRTITSSTANRAAHRDFFSYDFESPALRPGAILGQDRWMSRTGFDPSLTVGPGTGANGTQVIGGAGYGDWGNCRRFQWCREWPQITGLGAIVTEEFWAYATTPSNTSLVMGALWAPDSFPACGLFGMDKGKWYVRQAGAPWAEYRGDGGIKPAHWYDVKLVIDFSVPGGSATLYRRDVTAGETAFSQDRILHGIEMVIPQVPWGPRDGQQYEISGISVRPCGSSNDTGQFYLDNFSVRIERHGEDKLSKQKGG